MSFIIETTDMDLGDTPIENIFINDFMPMANGTFVKVYLLGYKYANDKDNNIELDNKTIAKHLMIPLSDVISAWDFWQSKGIIKKHPNNNDDEYDYSVEFLNLKQLYIKNNYKQVTVNSSNENKDISYTASVEDLIEANKVQSIQDMFHDISQIIRRPLVPNEKKKILEWIHNYNMNPDVISKAYFYSVEKKSKKNVNYVEGILRNWYDMNITTLEALQEHFKEKDERYYRYERIKSSLGFKSRYLSEGEMKVVDKWFEEWRFDLDMVLKACENTKNISNPNINYIDSILSSWHNKGIKNIDDIVVKDSKPNKNNTKPRGQGYGVSTNKPIKTKFHNFEQRSSKYTSDELDAIVKKISEKKLKGN